MNKSRAVLAASLLAFAGAASAEISITPTLTSDYDFRGISRSNREPAFQLGLTYTGETGMYMGVWGSNVKFLAPDTTVTKTEMDVYAGYAGGDAEGGVGYDAGIIYYGHPNQGNLNWPEVYGGITKGPFSAKLWYSWSMYNSTDTAYYADVNLTMPASDGFKILLHAGHSGGEYWSQNGGVGEYMDWSAGFSVDVKGATMTVKYADGSDLNVSHPMNLGRFVFSISTTLSSGD